jgi:hypothetical protein
MRRWCFQRKPTTRAVAAIVYERATHLSASAKPTAFGMRAVSVAITLEPNCAAFDDNAHRVVCRTNAAVDR